MLKKQAWYTQSAADCAQLLHYIETGNVAGINRMSERGQFQAAVATMSIRLGGIVDCSNVLGFQFIPSDLTQRLRINEDLWYYTGYDEILYELPGTNQAVSPLQEPTGTVQVR